MRFFEKGTIKDDKVYALQSNGYNFTKISAKTRSRAGLTPNEWY
jgi:hypothetical protein